MKSSFNKIAMENTLNSSLIPCTNQSNVSDPLRNNPSNNELLIPYSKSNANMKECAYKSLSVNAYEVLLFVPDLCTPCNLIITEAACTDIINADSECCVSMGLGRCYNLGEAFVEDLCIMESLNYDLLIEVIDNECSICEQAANDTGPQIRTIFVVMCFSIYFICFVL